MTHDPLQVVVRELAPDDHAYALSAWRESHKQADARPVPWPAYKLTYGREFAAILKGRDSLVLGAYALDGELLGFLAATPGKRVDVLHWIQVKHQNKAGEYLRRRGIMTALLSAAELGDRFIYTLRARRCRKPSDQMPTEVGAPIDQDRNGARQKGRTLDEILADSLAARGIVATHIPFRDWLKD